MHGASCGCVCPRCGDVSSPLLCLRRSEKKRLPEGRTPCPRKEFPASTQGRQPGQSALSSNSVAVHLEHSPPGSLGAKSHPNCDFQCSSGSPQGRKKIRTPYPGIRDPTRAEPAGSLSRIPPTLPRRCVCLSALSALDPVTAPKLSATEVGTPRGHAAA